MALDVHVVVRAVGVEDNTAAQRKAGAAQHGDGASIIGAVALECRAGHIHLRTAGNNHGPALAIFPVSNDMICENCICNRDLRGSSNVQSPTVARLRRRKHARHECHVTTLYQKHATAEMVRIGVPEGREIEVDECDLGRCGAARWHHQRAVAATAGGECPEYARL